MIRIVVVFWFLLGLLLLLLAIALGVGAGTLLRASDMPWSMYPFNWNRVAAWVGAIPAFGMGLLSLVSFSIAAALDALADIRDVSLNQDEWLIKREEQ